MKSAYRTTLPNGFVHGTDIAKGLSTPSDLTRLSASSGSATNTSRRAIFGVRYRFISRNNIPLDTTIGSSPLAISSSASLSWPARGGCCDEIEVPMIGKIIHAIAVPANNQADSALARLHPYVRYVSRIANPLMNASEYRGMKIAWP